MPLKEKKLKLVIILMLFATIFELCGIAILILINFITETNFLENFNSLLIDYFSLEELPKDKILKYFFL